MLQSNHKDYQNKWPSKIYKEIEKKSEEQGSGM